MPGDVIRDLTAAAQQVDVTTACSFLRLDLALVDPGTVQTILVNDVGDRGRMVGWRFGHCARCGETQRTDHEEEPTNRTVLLSDRKQHAVRKLSSHHSSVSSSSSVQRTSHPASHVQSCSRHGISVILCSRFRGTVVQCALEAASMNV